MRVGEIIMVEPPRYEQPLPSYDPARVLAVDIDETLFSMCKEFCDDNEDPIEFEFHGRQIAGHGLYDNLMTLEKFKKLGYRILIWSRSGEPWARAVVAALGYHDDSFTYMTKPLFYLDDRPCQEWMGERVWKDPNAKS